MHKRLHILLENSPQWGGEWGHPPHTPLHVPLDLRPVDPLLFSVNSLYSWYISANIGILAYQILNFDQARSIIKRSGTGLASGRGGRHRSSFLHDYFWPSKSRV